MAEKEGNDAPSLGAVIAVCDGVDAIDVATASSIFRRCGIQTAVMLCSKLPSSSSADAQVTQLTYKTSDGMVLHADCHLLDEKYFDFDLVALPG